jgi:hypothetical protein
MEWGHEAPSGWPGKGSSGGGAAREPRRQRVASAGVGSQAPVEVPQPARLIIRVRSTLSQIILPWLMFRLHRPLGTVMLTDRANGLDPGGDHTGLHDLSDSAIRPPPVRTRPGIANPPGVEAAILGALPVLFEISDIV